MSKNETHKEKMMRKKMERKNHSPKVSKKVINMRNEEDFFRMVMNSSPTMIHEDKYVPMDCILCGETMMSVHDTHDARPLKETCTAKESLETGNPNRCCSTCNAEKVHPARLGSFGLDPDDVTDIATTVTIGEYHELVKEGKVMGVPYHTGKLH
jgi:hypothetical protein